MATKTTNPRKHSGSTTCWPGFTHVPGTTPGSKGSCKPKAHQTKAEKRADSRAAAASRQRKPAA